MMKHAQIFHNMRNNEICKPKPLFSSFSSHTHQTHCLFHHAKHATVCPFAKRTPPPIQFSHGFTLQTLHDLILTPEYLPDYTIVCFLNQTDMLTVAQFHMRYGATMGFLTGQGVRRQTYQETALIFFVQYTIALFSIDQQQRNKNK